MNHPLDDISLYRFRSNLTTLMTLGESGDQVAFLKHTGEVLRLVTSYSYKPESKGGYVFISGESLDSRVVSSALLAMVDEQLEIVAEKLNLLYLLEDEVLNYKEALLTIHFTIHSE